MRTQVIRWIFVFLILFLANCGADINAQQMTPEQVQERVLERTRQIEERKAREKELKELSKQDTPTMRQARKEIEREEREAQKMEKEYMKATLSTNVQGCDSAPPRVNPKVGNVRGLKRSGLYSTVSVTIINRSSGSVDIISGFHKINLVEDLCSGGMVTLDFSPTIYDPMSIQFTLTAISRSSSGVKTHTRLISLYKPYTRYSSGYDFRQVSSQVWEIPR